MLGVKVKRLKKLKSFTVKNSCIWADSTIPEKKKGL